MRCFSDDNITHVEGNLNPIRDIETIETELLIKDIESVIEIANKTIEGFGELFRQISYEEIGTSTIQSRAVAGFANNTVVFCLPGSTGACRTAWEKIIASQLDADFRPCNFVKHLVEA